MISYICVLDFEATCEKDKLIHNQEIIEFPMIILDLKSNSIVDTFQ